MTAPRRYSTAIRRLLGALAAALAACSVHAAERPNIVIVIADDLGWRDVGFHGAQVKTPNLDRLASGGAVLNAMYVQPYSSQTRAALLTGRYPMRYGLQSLSIGRNAAYGLPKEERTVAQALHEKGYRTAFVGDWRLGHAQPEFWPTRRGFETFYGSLAGSSESVVRKGAKADWRRGEKPAVDAGYVTDLVAAETVAVIRKHDTSAPLFVVASFNAPAHYEDVPRELRESLKTVEDDTRRSYLAAVAGFDRALGAILAELERRQMSGSTLVVVLSDNGGAVPLRFATGDADVRRPAADNGNHREGKGSLYEGGVRAVAVASWPGRIPAGTVVTESLHATDLGATIMALGDGQPDAQRPLDGMDVWPVIAQRKQTPHKELLLHVDDFQGAIRIGEWKLIVRAALPSRTELYDIANDPEEAENAVATYPDRAKAMLDRLNAFAYDMAPSLYFEALGAAASPALWRANPPRRD